MFKFPTPGAKIRSNAPSHPGKLKRDHMNLFQKLEKNPCFLKLLPKGKRNRWHSLEREGGRKNPESRESQGGLRERSPNRRRNTGSIAIIRCSCRKKKKKKKKTLALYWTWICRGSKLDAFPKQEEFYWDPKTRKKVTRQVTAQNVPGLSEDKTVYAVSNRKRKTTIITG